LNTFAFEWNGHTSDLTATATVDLLTGEGTGGTLLGSTTGKVVEDTIGEYAGYAFFVADFGSVVLAPGQYTVYFHDATSTIQLLGSTKDVSAYSGGKLVTSSYGDWGNDATFFTPSPAGGTGDVPEPGTILLLGGSLLGLCIGAFRRFHK